MSDFAPGTYLPTSPLAGKLGQMFKDAAAKDATIQGMKPFEFFQSLKDKNEEQLSELGLDAGWMAAGYFGGGVAGGLVNAMILGPIGLIFEGIMAIDGNRTMTLSVVNALDTDLTLYPSNAHLETGSAVVGFGTGDSTGAVVAPNVLSAANSINLIDGPTMGFLLTQKNRTLGVGFYGTEGAIWLKPSDPSLLPEGVFIGWREPETGDCTCAVSVNGYRDAKEFYNAWVNSDKKPNTRQTDGSTYAGTMKTDPNTGTPYPKPKVTCAISSVTENNIAMVAYIGTED